MSDETGNENMQGRRQGAGGRGYLETSRDGEERLEAAREAHRSR